MADRRTKIILGLDAGPYVRGLAKASTATKAFTKELDSSDSRMGNLVQTSLALGPALVPIAAAGVPAVAALTAGLGAAAGAAGVAALAFNGIGDGLKALNEYQLEPSAENLAKVRQAFEEIGPAGAQFVQFLDKLEPKLDKLQNTARAGLFPGVEDGIRSLMDRAPQVNRIIAEISGALGDLAAEGGDALASDKFDAFFDYIEHEARPILMDMGRTLGNVTEGLANMLVAFDPLSDQFSGGLLDMSRDFARWSRSLEDNDSFQEFVDYIQRVSPEVVDTLGALVVAIADIVEAAAPVGEVTLPVIKALAQILGQIADSPVGPVLVATAAGLSALSRAVAVYNVANGSAITQMIGKLGKARIAAAGVGLLATSMTDLDDKLGLTNTAMGASIGLLGGLKGGVAGLAAGALLDASVAAEDLAVAVERANDAMSDPTAIREQQAAIKGLKRSIDNNIVQGFDDLQDLPTSIGAVFNALKSGDWDFPDIQDMEIDSKRMVRTLANLRDEVKGGWGKSAFTTDLGKLERFASNAAPALRKVGIELKDLDPEDPEWDRAVRAIKRYNAEADSIPGRTKNVRGAIKGLDNPLISAADSADKLDAALSSLFDPELDAREALIAWKQGLVDLRKQIRGTSGSLRLNTQAGRDNQTAIIGQIRSLKEVAVAQARQDGNSKRATKTLRDGRQAIINAGVESGISADKMKRLVNQMGLVPKTVQPKVDVKGTGKAKDDIKSVVNAITKAPKKLDVFTDTPGSDKSQAEIKGLTKLLDLTPDKHDVKIATPGQREAMRDLGLLENQTKDVPDNKKIDTDAPGADHTRNQMQGLKGDIDKIHGKTVDVKLSTAATKIVSSVKDVFGSIFSADGNIIDFNANGDIKNGHTAQIAPAGAWRVWAEDETGGEAYIPFAPSKRPRSLDIWRETGRRLGADDVDYFADGGVRANTGGNDPSKPLGRIDRMWEAVAGQIGVGLGKYLSQVALSSGGGFHWPVPRQYGYTGTWGHYSSGGSHPALDFPAPTGTDIFSVLPGRVTGTTSLGDTSYGNYTEVAHGHGISSLYAHQSAFRTKPGATIASGEHIGEVGAVGNTTGPHLHLELKKNGTSFDYTSWLKGGGPAWTQGSSAGIYEGDHDGLDHASPSQAQAYAHSILGRYNWPETQWPYWLDLGNRESGWRWNALNPSSGAYGIPQSLPGSKMATSGPDWRTNAGTQVDWMAGYIAERYGGPHGAISWHNAHNWYGDGGINLFDKGGTWKSGTLGANMSGHDEAVLSPAATRDMHRLIQAIQQVVHSGGVSGRRFRAPDLESHAEHQLNRAEHRLDRSKDQLDRAEDRVKRAEKALDDAKGKQDKERAHDRLKAAEDRADSAEKRRNKAERDLDRAKQDRRTAHQDQRSLDRAFKRFDIKPGMDRSRVKSEVNELLQSVRQALGKDSGLFKALDRFRDRLKGAAKRLDEERREREKLNDKLKSLRQKSNEYSGTVAGNFRNDPFSGGLDEFALQVRADRNDAKSMKRALGRASRKGLDGGLYKQLAASGNMELAQQFGRLGRQEIRKYEALFEQRNRRSSELGDRAARHVYGERLRKYDHSVNHLDRTIRRLEHRLEKLGNHVQDGARKGTREGQDHRIKRLHQMVTESRG